MTEDHPTPFALEAHHAGEPAAAVAAHVASCGPCRDYVAGLERERSARARDLPSSVFMARLAAPAQSRQRPSRWLWALPAVLAAALALFVALPRSSEEGGRLKGGPIGLALIVERDGTQRRASGSLDIQAGDRLRVELSLTEAAVVTVGVLEDVGGFAPIATARRFEAGTHLLEPALRVDSHPTAGTLIAGPPEAVDGAIVSRDPSGLAAVRLELR